MVSFKMPPDPKSVDYSDIAKSIAGEKRALWLKEFLAEYAVILWQSLAVDQVTPTRRALKGRLEEMAMAAELLVREMKSAEMYDFLQSAGLDEIENVNRFRSNLVVLAACAGRAARSPAITASDGNAKAGRGRAMLDDAFSSHVLCAVVIAEAWKGVHGHYPPARNSQAQEAAALFWARCGGESPGHLDDKSERWRRHLQDAVRETVPQGLEDWRSQVRRYLIQTQHDHGLPPSNI